MAKDKQTKDFRMQDMYASHQQSTSAGARELKEHMPNLAIITYDEEFENKVKEYNKNIENLDEDYKAVIPHTRLLVRMYLREVQKDESGVVIPHQRQLLVKTNSGIGNYGSIPDPYPFSNKAVVVATPEFGSFKSGDVVLLNHNQTATVGSGKDAQVIVPNAFIHPDVSAEEFMPVDPSKREYGYLWISTQDVNGFLKKAPREEENKD